jgi:uncharacterized protein (TIGR02300 family)
MATKAARGTKRTCQNSDCESRFYDLNRSPIVCPICQSEYVIASAPQAIAAVAPAEDAAAARRAAKKPVVAPQPSEDAEAPAMEGEEALADVEAAEEAAAGEEDETFLEEEEEDGGDVTNIIGGPVAEGDEEP